MAKGKGGRPRFVFDKDKLADITDLASEGATMEEICRYVGCSKTTFCANEEAMNAYHDGQNDMKISLRHWQMMQAKSGNVQMLIWLGKIVLGQKEKTEIENTIRMMDAEIVIGGEGPDEDQS